MSPSSSGNDPRRGTRKPKTATAVIRNTWDDADQGEGCELPHEQLPGTDRGHDELLHGPHLLLAHDPIAESSIVMTMSTMARTAGT